MIKEWKLWCIKVLISWKGHAVSSHNQAYTYNLLEKNQLIKMPNIIFSFHNNFVLMCNKLFTVYPVKTMK